MGAGWDSADGRRWPRGHHGHCRGDAWTQTREEMDLGPRAPSRPLPLGSAVHPASPCFSFSLLWVSYPVCHCSPFPLLGEGVFGLHPAVNVAFFFQSGARYLTTVLFLILQFLSERSRLVSNPGVVGVRLGLERGLWGDQKYSTFPPLIPSLIIAGLLLIGQLFSHRIPVCCRNLSHCWVWRCTSAIPAFREAEAGGL